MRKSTQTIDSIQSTEPEDLPLEIYIEPSRTMGEQPLFFSSHAKPGDVIGFLSGANATIRFDSASPFEKFSKSFRLQANVPRLERIKPLTEGEAMTFQFHLEYEDEGLPSPSLHLVVTDEGGIQQEMSFRFEHPMKVVQVLHIPRSIETIRVENTLKNPFEVIMIENGRLGDSHGVDSTFEVPAEKSRNLPTCGAVDYEYPRYSLLLPRGQTSTGSLLKKKDQSGGTEYVEIYIDP